MIDGRQVMYDIERCVSHVPDACRDCSHYTGTVGFECMEKLMSDALELLKQQHGLMLALEQANATINYLNEEKEKAIRDIDLYIADAENDTKTPPRTGKGYSVGLGYGLLIAKEILQGIRNHG